MASRSVKFHPDAEREYLTSLDWYRERSLTAALNFEEEFHRVIAKIQEAPDRWPRYFKVCKRFVLHQFPFSIVYQVPALPNYRPCRRPWTPASGVLEGAPGMERT